MGSERQQASHLRRESRAAAAVEDEMRLIFVTFVAWKRRGACSDIGKWRSGDGSARVWAYNPSDRISFRTAVN